MPQIQSLGRMDPPAWLQDSCRVCGGRLSRYKVSYDCHTTINKAKLRLIGVFTANDREGVHPQRFCFGCNNICTRTENANEESLSLVLKSSATLGGAPSFICATRSRMRYDGLPIGAFFGFLPTFPATLSISLLSPHSNLVSRGV